MGLRPPVFSVEELQAAGVKRISVGGAFARAALGAFVRAAREVKESGTFDFSVEAITGAEISRYMADERQ
jgi:2-methylisocitrate lyase-like PEP mutase family enzyme